MSADKPAATPSELRALLDACNKACYVGEDHQEPAFLCDGGKSAQDLAEFMLAHYDQFVRSETRVAISEEMVEAGAKQIHRMIAGGILEGDPLNGWEPWAGTARSILEATLKSAAPQAPGNGGHTTGDSGVPRPAVAAPFVQSAEIVGPDAWSTYCMAFRDLFGHTAPLELSPSALEEFVSRWSSKAATPGAYRWIKAASDALKRWLEAAPPAADGAMARLMGETDSLLSGVPVPPEADRYARAWHALNSSTPSSDGVASELGLERESHETTKRMLADAQDDVERLHGHKMAFLERLLTCRLRCGYIINHCRDHAQAKGEAEEMLRVIEGALKASAAPAARDTAPHIIADSVSDDAKAKAFEWLRLQAVSGNMLAAIAQDEWHRCREADLSVPSATECKGDGIYVASRVSRADMWRHLRDCGVRITASWIDEAGDGETASFTELWKRIQREIAGSRGLIFYGDVDDAPWKGALIEVGIALALGKPVAAVIIGELEGRTYRPVGSWLHHQNVTRCKQLQEAITLLGGRTDRRTDG